MRLTRFTDYSLRVLMYAASHPDRRVTIDEVARGFNISENHLMKVVHFLAREGLLTSMRGKGGGIVLAAPTEAINLGRVVRLTEGRPLPAECFDPATNTCVITPVCRLRTALEEAVAAFYAALDRYTLADFARNRHVLARIIAMPRHARSNRFAKHAHSPIRERT